MFSLITIYRNPQGMSDSRRLPSSWGLIARDRHADGSRSIILDRRFSADYPLNYCSQSGYQEDYSQSGYQEDYTHTEYQPANYSKEWQYQEEFSHSEWQQGYHQSEYSQGFGYQSWGSRDYYYWRSNKSYGTCNQLSQSSFRRGRSRGRDRAEYTAAKYLWPRETPSLSPTPDQGRYNPRIQKPKAGSSGKEKLSRNSQGRDSTTEGKPKTNSLEKEKLPTDSQEISSVFKGTPEVVSLGKAPSADSQGRESASKENPKYGSSSIDELSTDSGGQESANKVKLKPDFSPKEELYSDYTGRENTSKGKPTVVSSEKEPSADSQGRNGASKGKPTVVSSGKEPAHFEGREHVRKGKPKPDSSLKEEHSTDLKGRESASKRKPTVVSSEKEPSADSQERNCASKGKPDSSPKDELSGRRKEEATHEPAFRDKTASKEPPVEAEMIGIREAKPPGKALAVADQCPTVGSTQETRSPAQQMPTTSDVVRTSKERVWKSEKLTGKRSPKSGDLKPYKIPKCHRPLVTGSETCQKGKPRDQEKPTAESSGKNVGRHGHDGRELPEHRNGPASDVNRVDSSTSAKERSKTLLDGWEEKPAHAGNRKRFIPEIKFGRDPREEVKKNAASAQVSYGSGGNAEHLKRLTVKDYLNRNVEKPDAHKRLRGVTKHTSSVLPEVTRSIFSPTSVAEETTTENVSRVTLNTSSHSSTKEGSLRNDLTVFPKPSSRARESYGCMEVATNVLVGTSKINPKSCSTKESVSRKDVSNISPFGLAFRCKNVSRDVIVASDHSLKPSSSAEAVSRKSSLKLLRFEKSVRPKGNPRNSFIASPNTSSKSPYVKTSVTPIEVTKDLSKMPSDLFPKSSPICQVPKVLADTLKNVPSSFTDFQEKFINEVLPAAGLPVNSKHGENVQQLVEQLTCAYSNGSPERPTQGKAANPTNEAGNYIPLAAEPYTTTGLNSNDVTRGSRPVADAPRQTDTEDKIKYSREFRGEENSRRSIKPKCANLDLPFYPNANQEFETNLGKLLTSKSDSDVAVTIMPQAENFYSSRSQIASVLEDSGTPPQEASDMYSPSKPSSSKSSSPIFSPTVVSSGEKPGTANQVTETRARDVIATVPAASLRLEELREEDLKAYIRRCVDDELKKKLHLRKSRSSCKHSSKRSTNRRHFSHSMRRRSSDSKKKLPDKLTRRDSFTKESCEPSSEVKKDSSNERKSNTKRPRSSSASDSDVAMSLIKRRRIRAPLNESDTEETAAPTKAIETGETPQRSVQEQPPLPSIFQTPTCCTEEIDLVTPDSAAHQSGKPLSEVMKDSLNEHESNSKRSRPSSARNSDSGHKTSRGNRASLNESDAEEDATPAQAIETGETPQCSVHEQAPLPSSFQTPTRSTDDIDLATPDSSARVSSCDRFSLWTSYEFDNIPPRIESSGSLTDAASQVASFVIPLTSPSVISLKSVQVDECNSTSVPTETVEYIDISDAENDTHVEMPLKSEEPSPEEEPLETSDIQNDYPDVPSPAYSTASTSSMRTVCIYNQDRKKQLFEPIKKELAYDVICLSDDDEETDSWNTMSELDKLKIKEFSELYLECYRSLQLFVTHVRESFNYTEAVRVAVEDRSREELFKTFLPFCKYSEEKKKHLCKDFTEAEVFNLVDERLRTYKLPPLGGNAGFAQMLGLLKQLNKRKTKKNWGRIESLPNPSDNLSIVEAVQQMLHLPFESDVRYLSAAAARSTPLRTSTDSSSEMIPIITNVTSLDMNEESLDCNGCAGAMLYDGYSPDTTRTVDFEPLLEPSPSVANICPAVELEPSVTTFKREGRECLTCGVQAEIRCSYCRDAHYCSRNCQTTHWNSVHHYYCNANTTETLEYNAK